MLEPKWPFSQTDKQTNNKSITHPMLSFTHFPMCYLKTAKEKGIHIQIDIVINESIFKTKQFLCLFESFISNM